MYVCNMRIYLYSTYCFDRNIKFDSLAQILIMLLKSTCKRIILDIKTFTIYLLKVVTHHLKHWKSWYLLILLFCKDFVDPDLKNIHISKAGNNLTIIVCPKWISVNNKILKNFFTLNYLLLLTYSSVRLDILCYS